MLKERQLFIKTKIATTSSTQKNQAKLNFSNKKATQKVKPKNKSKRKKNISCAGSDTHHSKSKQPSNRKQTAD